MLQSKEMLPVHCWLEELAHEKDTEPRLKALESVAGRCARPGSLAASIAI
jgi:hypothetical protein